MCTLCWRLYFAVFYLLIKSNILLTFLSDTLLCILFNSVLFYCHIKQFYPPFPEPATAVHWGPLNGWQLSSINFHRKRETETSPVRDIHALTAKFSILFKHLSCCKEDLTPKCLWYTQKVSPLKSVTHEKPLTFADAWRIKMTTRGNAHWNVTEINPICSCWRFWPQP